MAFFISVSFIVTVFQVSFWGDSSALYRMNSLPGDGFVQPCRPSQSLTNSFYYCLLEKFPFTVSPFCVVWGIFVSCLTIFFLFVQCFIEKGNHEREKRSKIFYSTIMYIKNISPPLKYKLQF